MKIREIYSLIINDIQLLQVISILIRILVLIFGLFLSDILFWKSAAILLCASSFLDIQVISLLKKSNHEIR